MAKPTVLLLGGCGFIGRNFLTYLVENDLASRIRVVDKVPPQVAWLNAKHQAIFHHSNVQFCSANLINLESAERAFEPIEAQPWDYVVNCAGETKPGQTEAVYKEGIVKLSLNCAKLAAKQNVQHYVEISSGHMASNEKTAHEEDAPVQPWTFAAKYKAQVERNIETIPDLKFTILRPALVYGIGDKSSLTPRLVIAAVYRQLGETMKLMWNEKVVLNTVHVRDLARAIWHVCGRTDTIGQTYNVVDSGMSTQGSVTKLISDLFEINYEYYGNVLSSLVKTELGDVLEDVNDKHSGPWAEACKSDSVENTPLTPFMNEEWLYHKHLHLNGSKLARTGFELTVPSLTADELKEVINDFVEMNIFPRSLCP